MTKKNKESSSTAATTHAPSSPTSGTAGSFVNTLFRSIKKSDEEKVRDSIIKQYKISSSTADAIPKHIKESIHCLIHPENNQPLLFNAVRSGADTVLKVLCEEFGVSPEAIPKNKSAKDKNGQPIVFPPPFLEAARLDDDVLVRFFIESTEANLMATDDKTGQNVFHFIAQSGSSALFEFLLDDVPNPRFECGCCEETKKAEMKRSYVTGKAFLLLAKDNSGDTPLNLFASNQSPSMMEAAIKYLQSLVLKHKEDYSNVKYLVENVHDILLLDSKNVHQHSHSQQQQQSKNNNDDDADNETNNAAAASEGGALCQMMESSSLTSSRFLNVLDIAVNTFKIDPLELAVPSTATTLLQKVISSTAASSDGDSNNNNTNGKFNHVFKTLFSNRDHYKPIPNLKENNPGVQDSVRFFMTKAPTVLHLALRVPIDAESLMTMFAVTSVAAVENEPTSALESIDSVRQKLQATTLESLYEKLDPAAHDEDDEIDAYFDTPLEASNFVTALDSCVRSLIKREVLLKDFGDTFTTESKRLLASFEKELQVVQDERKRAQEEIERRKNMQLVGGDYGSNSSASVAEKNAVDRAREAMFRVQAARQEKIRKRREQEALEENEDDEDAHLSPTEKLLRQQYGNKKKKLIKAGNLFGKGKSINDDEDNNKNNNNNSADQNEEAEESDDGKKSSKKNLSSNDSGRKIENKKESNEVKDTKKELSPIEKFFAFLLVVAFILGFLHLVFSD